MKMRVVGVLLAALLAAQEVQAETSVVGGVGYSEFKIGEETEHGPIYSIQGNYSTLWGGANTGGVTLAGLGFTMYDGPDVAAGEDESFGVYDFSAYGAVGFRFGPAAVLGILEGRYPTYANNQNESGSGSYLGYGGGLLLRLGADETLLSRIYIQGSYLVGTSDVDELSQPGVEDETKSYDVTDIKGRLTYRVSKHWAVFGEFRRTEYDPSSTSPASEERRLDSYTLSVGKYF